MEEGTGRDAMWAERKKAWVEVERTDAGGMRVRFDGSGVRNVGSGKKYHRGKNGKGKNDGPWEGAEDGRLARGQNHRVRQICVPGFVLHSILFRSRD
jgi:hypothetical protein